MNNALSGHVSLNVTPCQWTFRCCFTLTDVLTQLIMFVFNVLIDLDDGRNTYNKHCLCCVNIFVLMDVRDICRQEEAAAMEIQNVVKATVAENEKAYSDSLKKAHLERDEALAELERVSVSKGLL